MTARFLHGEFFDFTPKFKIFLAVNHKPIIEGTDHAIWRRIRLIPFTVTISESEQDKTLPQKLLAERAGILRWAVEGCLLWQKEGLQPPKAVTEATQEYRDEMDTVSAFIEERCVLDANAEISPTALYDQYSLWAEVHQEKPMNRAAFGTRLSEKGFVKGRTGTRRFWRGLKVTP